uniref:Uncharacterized protein n=1 Tax=Trypanosoma congolense (strain IL3000) TaxID=1068625 RepID=G0UQL8_TRYCI|nr:hypothetical protein, unlikely [Trypanosoma congolense IL3000]
MDLVILFGFFFGMLRCGLVLLPYALSGVLREGWCFFLWAFLAVTEETHMLLGPVSHVRYLLLFFLLFVFFLCFSGEFKSVSLVSCPLYCSFASTPLRHNPHSPMLPIRLTSSSQGYASGMCGGIPPSQCTITICIVRG